MEPEEDAPPIPHQVAPETKIETVAADDRFLAANEAFLTAWAEGRIEEAIEFFSRRCQACVNLYLAEGQEPVQSWEEARRRWQAGLGRVSEQLHQAADIRELVEPVEIVHPDLRLVDHPRRDHFTLISLPNSIAENYDCERIQRGELNFTEPAQETYGEYYATAIRFNLVGEDPAVLYLLWSREAGQWKITSYSILRP